MNELMADSIKDRYDLGICYITKRIYSGLDNKTHIIDIIYPESDVIDYIFLWTHGYLTVMNKNGMRCMMNADIENNSGKISMISKIKNNFDFFRERSI